MKNLYKEKKVKSFRIFLLITAVPVIGVIIIFSLFAQNIQNKIEFTTHELRGLDVISEIQRSIMDIQKIRGLISIENPNEATLEELKYIKKDIIDSVSSLEKKISNIKSDAALRKEILNFTRFIKETKLDSLNFEELTIIVKELISYSNRISYHSKLILDDDLDIFVSVNNIVFLFVDLIEHNGQIRGIAVNTKNGTIDFNQRHKINIQLDKIDEKLQRLDFNLFLLGEVAYDNKLEVSYENMKEAQKVIVEFTKTELLKADGIRVDPNGIYEQITKNIDSLITLYEMNLNILKQNLQNRLEKKKIELIYTVVFGFLSLLFIIIINRIFYLKNREYIDKIEELTITDGMTTLYNRRYFDETFENYLRSNQRNKQVPVFIIMDIDHFKEYNDTYGHQAGDVAIKRVANIMKTSLKRATDMAFRLGGEEFGILCSGLNAIEALHLAHAIREGVESEKIEHKNSKVNEYLTISIGIIVIEEGRINSIKEIYKCADKALYKAKKNGRNQAVLYDEKMFLED